jgi:hypothetical protein
LVFGLVLDRISGSHAWSYLVVSYFQLSSRNYV